MRYMTMSQHKDLYLTISMISLVFCSWLEVMNIPFDLASNTISFREMLNFLEAYLSCTGFDACSLQPTNGGPRNEVSAQYEPRQRSDVAHQHQHRHEDQHEDQELSIPGCVT